MLPATADVTTCAELQPIVTKYNEWASQAGYPQANHFIATHYIDGKHSIGMHFDKEKSIQPGSLITVVKTGAHGRPFRLEWLDGRLIFERVLPPGTAVIMTLEANLLTRHGVPEVAEAGPSGSLVFRSIMDTVSWAKLEKKLDTASRKRRAARNGPKSRKAKTA